MVMRWQTIIFAAALGTVDGVSVSTGVGRNPVRKVVNLLQSMQKKVTEEGQKAESLYEKFMCYCTSSGGSLTTSISAAETKLPELTSSIKASSSRKIQLDEDVKAHKADRASARKSMAEATALREKSKAVYDKQTSDDAVNIVALKAAISALQAGVPSSFLQSPKASIVRSFVDGKHDIAAGDRQDLVSFLSGQQESAPTGEIIGLLKAMLDEMQLEMLDMDSVEETSINVYNELMAAKKKEVVALNASIEDKLGRLGGLGVEIANMKNDAEDTSESLAADQKFRANLKKNCAQKTGIHEAEKAQRAAEVVALADTIKVLNDDDALELFKKTLPSSSSSLMQVQESSAAMRNRVRESLSRVHAKSSAGHRPGVDFILLALRGNKVGFAKIMTMVDELVSTLKKEQKDDETKKDYCAANLGEADEKKRSLERSISDVGVVIEESKESLATVTEEIEDFRKGIMALDKSVADATTQRQAENAEYKELMSSNGAAKELILFAKNRLLKFYNPSVHKAAPKRELSEEDRIYENEGGEIPTEAPGGIADTGISAFVQLRDVVAPPLPPATADAYTKSSEKSGGVMAMMDILVQDLDKEMITAKTEEKNSKDEYESTMADSAEKRREDSKILTDKSAAKADVESLLEKSTKEEKSTVKELMGTEKYIGSLHSECDWLLKYFDVRKEARTDEVDSLVKAKAVLSGADFSFIQRHSLRAHKFLARQ